MIFFKKASVQWKVDDWSFKRRLTIGGIQISTIGWILIRSKKEYDWWDSNIRRVTIGWILIRSKKGYDWWGSNIRRATIGWIHDSIVRT